MKRSFKIIAIVIIGLFLVFAFYKMISMSDDTICRDFRIEIVNADEHLFVSADSLLSDVRSGYQEVKGLKMSTIDLDKIKDIIQQNLFVRNVKVYQSLDGVVIAEIEQREPLVRVFASNGKPFVIDKMGDIMPVPAGKSLFLICATGHIPVDPDSMYGRNIQHVSSSDTHIIYALNSIYLLAKALNLDKHFSNLISQIYLNEENEFVLIPSIGDLEVIFGDATAMEQKLEKLFILYTKMLPYMDLSAYRMADIRFENQIILQK